jgi:hypothetical protein
MREDLCSLQKQPEMWLREAFHEQPLSLACHVASAGVVKASATVLSLYAQSVKDTTDIVCTIRIVGPR